MWSRFLNFTVEFSYDLVSGKNIGKLQSQDAALCLRGDWSFLPSYFFWGNSTIVKKKIPFPFESHLFSTSISKERTASFNLKDSKSWVQIKSIFSFTRSPQNIGLIFLWHGFLVFMPFNRTPLFYIFDNCFIMQWHTIPRDCTKCCECPFLCIQLRQPGVLLGWCLHLLL